MHNLLFAFRYLLKPRGGNLARLVSLTLALAVSIVVFSYANYVLTYDRFYPDVERIYQLWDFDDEGNISSSMIAPLGPALQEEIPAVEAFKPEHDRDSTARFIVNDLLARKGLKVGDRLDPGVVIGICPDIHYRPLQYPTEPFAFVTGTCWQTRMSRFYVRLAAGFDLDAVCEGIQEKARTFDPGSEVSDFRFFDEEINVQYARERRIATIVGLFTVLAVVIALMGVFGIVLFETQHRRREVAIRKVMGATTAEVLRLFNRRYVVLVAVCFLLAAPAGYWIVDRWLASFAYRTPIRWWVFAAAFAVVLLVTAATVTFCSWRTANENPADCVKSE